MSTIQDFRLVSLNRDRYETIIQSKPDVQRAISYFKKNIGTITSADQLLADDKLYRFVMTAFDLESQIYAKALMKKVLSEGVTDEKSTANRMTDKKFREMATVLSFAETQGAPLKVPSVVQAIADRYVTVKLEVQSEEQNAAVRLALYFQRKAPAITSWFNVLGDEALRKVAFTALGIPEAAGAMDIDRLASNLARKYDVKDFQDPAKVQKFLEKFSVMYDIESGTAGSTATAAALMKPLNRSRGSSIIALDSTILKTLTNFPRF